MLKNYTIPCMRREGSFLRRIPSGLRAGHRSFAFLVLLLAFSQSACLFKGSKSAVMPTTPARIGFLPFNAPEDSKELQWTSMAMPVMMAIITKDAQGLEPVPLWETMRFTLESVRDSRTVTSKDASYVANWLNLKWAVMGDLPSESNEKISLLIDYIPPAETSIPFRYTKKIPMENVDANVRKAFNQFLNYISSPPLDKQNNRHITLASVRQLAEALDREYGWSVPAEPGKAGEIVSNLAQSDIGLARQLFNPTLYSILQEK